MKKTTETHKEKPEQPKYPEDRKSEDPKDVKIRLMTDVLVYLKDNVLHGNRAHVAMIESVLGDKWP